MSVTFILGHTILIFIEWLTAFKVSFHHLTYILIRVRLGTVIQVYNTHTQDAEKGVLWLQGQSRVSCETLSHKAKGEKKNHWGRQNSSHLIAKESKAGRQQIPHKLWGSYLEFELKLCMLIYLYNTPAVLSTVCTFVLKNDVVRQIFICFLRKRSL